MPDQTKSQYQESDPRHHTQKLKQMAKVSDPKAQALFETSAEVLLGLAKAFEDFAQKSEAAWKAAGSR